MFLKTVKTGILSFLVIFKPAILRILSVLFIMMVSFTAQSQGRETLIKAGYIEKFIHFVEWPEGIAENTGDKPTVTISILGDDLVFSALNELIGKSEIKNINYKVTKIDKLEDLNGCMVLFIAGPEKGNLERILSFTSGKPILTIGDTKGYCEKGVIINMFQEGNYIRYEINQKALEKSGLVIKSLLLNYAVIKG